MAVVISEDTIAALGRRIAEAVRPRRIVLSGSAARGEAGPDSDIDVLVTMSDRVHRGHTTEETYRRLWGFGIAEDMVVVTEGDVALRRDDPYTVIRQALAEGREVYRAP